MLSLCSFSFDRKLIRSSSVCVLIMKTSSMYHLQMCGFLDFVNMNSFSNLSMKIFASQGAALVPIAVPCF